MQNTVMSPDTPKEGTLAWPLAILVAAWFLVVLYAAATGLLANQPGEPPLAIVVAVTVPILVFAGFYRGSAAFRAFVLGTDPVLIAMLQSWRVLGLMFVVLATYGILPGSFAYPAGFGDAAIGVTAPAIALYLLRRPDFATSKTFVVWNLLGLLDFAGAIGTGVLASGNIPGFAAGAVTTAPMNVLPLALIPGFLVPAFIILHLTALLQARRKSA